MVAVFEHCMEQYSRSGRVFLMLLPHPMQEISSPCFLPTPLYWQDGEQYLFLRGDWNISQQRSQRCCFKGFSYCSAFASRHAEHLMPLRGPRPGYGTSTPHLTQQTGLLLRRADRLLLPAAQRHLLEQYLRGLSPSDLGTSPPQTGQHLPSLVHPPLTHSGCTRNRLPDETAD